MANGMAIGSRDERRMLDLACALGASLDLHAVWKDAFPLLLPLIDADYGALATSRSERAEDYEWIVQDLPPAFLGSYADMAPHDFVRGAVLSKINTVVRDSEMIPRRALERNMMYHRAREVGAPLEHVMAVMLDVGSGPPCGLSLYRERRHPFAEREQRILQELTRPIANAIRHCRLFGKAGRWNKVHEALLGARGDAVILVRPPAHEIDRTPSATSLLEAWFTPVERGAGGLPQVLLDELAKARAAAQQGRGGPWRWKKEGPAASLHVRMSPWFEPSGDSAWMLRLREVPLDMVLPAEWSADLSEREREVTSRILRGWDDKLIAQDLGCAPTTVKKHVRSIFAKLRVADRKKLLSWYLEIRDE